MKKSTKLYLDVLSIVLGFAGSLFCSLTGLLWFTIINGLCVVWGVFGVLTIGDYLDEKEG